MLNPLEKAGLFVLPWMLAPKGESNARLWSDLLELRTSVLRGAAELAAQNATGPDCVRLIEVTDTLDKCATNREKQQADFEFFKALVEATGNTMLTMVVDSLEFPLGISHQSWEAMYPQDFDTQMHRACVQAIAEHDAVAAAEAMTAYGRYGQLIAQAWSTGDE